MTVEFPPGLLDYFAVRERQRQADIDQAWPQLQADVAGFLDRFRDSPHLAHGVAKLVRELAIAAFVRGSMYGPFTRSDAPTDSFMLYVARETTQDMPGIYRTFALLDGRTETEMEEDGD
jgi:hypothetical protein